MTLIEKLIGEKNTVFKTVRAKITEELDNKIKFISDNTGVKEEEYLGMILEQSEIDKVYKNLVKKNKSANEDDLDKIE
jgi:hypothetical protein